METVVEGNGEGKRFVAMAPSNVAVSWRCRVSHVDRRLGDIGRKEGAEAVRGLRAQADRNGRRGQRRVVSVSSLTRADVAVLLRCCVLDVDRRLGDLSEEEEWRRCAG